MATLTLRNVPDELYAALKESAKRNRRSLNQEAIAELARARETHDEEAHWMTADEIDRFINEGRERRDLMLAAGLGGRRDFVAERVRAHRKELEGTIWVNDEDLNEFIEAGRK